MKKNIVLIVISFLSLNAFAQGTWEVPQETKSQPQEKQALIGKSKAIDPKYMQGAVTEVDGKVCWDKKYDMPGMTASQVYEKVLSVMQQFVKTDVMLEKSGISVVNKETNQIGVRVSEMLIFSSKALSLDQTIFNYNLVINCHDGGFDIRMAHLNYHYEIGRPSEAHYTAEEMIADGVAFNKKGTKFQKGGVRKFREKTIDRKDAIFAWIESKVK